MASVVLPAGVVAAWMASLPIHDVSLVVACPLLLAFLYPTISSARWLYEQLGASLNIDFLPRVRRHCTRLVRAESIPPHLRA